MSNDASRSAIALSLAALCALLLASCAETGKGREPAGEVSRVTGTFEGSVVQTLEGAPPIERESRLRLEFDDEGRLLAWQGQPRRSYVLTRLLEEQRCGQANIDALLAPQGVLQIACPDDLSVTFRTLEYRTEPDFALVVELASESSPLPTGGGSTRGRGSELYRITDEGLEVDIFIQLVLEQEKGDPARVEQRIEGLLKPLL